MKCKGFFFVWMHQVVLRYIQEMIRQHNNISCYINIYVRLHVSTIQVVIIRSLVEITGLQKAAHTFWDPKLCLQVGQLVT